MIESYNSKNLYNSVMRCLRNIAEMIEYEITTKFGALELMVQV